MNWFYYSPGSTQSRGVVVLPYLTYFLVFGLGPPACFCTFLVGPLIAQFYLVSALSYLSGFKAPRFLRLFTSLFGVSVLEFGLAE